MVMHARGGDVRVTDAVLDFFEIGVVFESVQDGRGAQRVRTEAVDADVDADAEHALVAHTAAFRQVDQVERAQFGAAQTVMEQRG